MTPRPYSLAADGGSITCQCCGLTSHNANDVAHHYCGACHMFLDDVVITVWVIYDHPKDFPTSWVLRAQSVLYNGAIKPHAACHAAATLDGARAGLPPGLVNIQRQGADDPRIHECWI